MARRRLTIIGLAMILSMFAAWGGIAHGAMLVESPPSFGSGPHPMQDQPETTEPNLYDDSVLHDIEIVFEDDDWQRMLERMDASNPTDLPASLTFDGYELDRVGVRYKGNTSQRVASVKKPFNLKTKSFVDGQKLWGYDVINLNNSASDPTMLREALGYRMLRPYMPVPQTAYARVTAQGNYLGVYLMVEQINREMVDAWFPSDKGIVIKGDPAAGARLETSSLTFLGEAIAQYERFYEVKTEGREDEGYEHLRELTRALSAAPRNGGLSDDRFADGVRELMDVEHALWYLAGSNLIQNGDSYYAGHNYYLYETPREPRFHMLTWDLNMSFGVFPISGMAGGPQQPGQPPKTPDTDDLATESPFVADNKPSRPLVRRLLGTPKYRADYVAHLRTIRDEALEPGRVALQASTYRELIDDAVQAEPDPIFNYSMFQRNLRQDVTVASSRGPGRFTPGLLKLAEGRYAYLVDHPDLASPDVSLADHGLLPEQPSATDSVDARAVFGGDDEVVMAELRYRVDGGAEMIVPMTEIDRGARIGTVPAQRAGSTVSYVFRGETRDGRAVFFPPRTITEPFTYEVAGAQLPRGETGDLVLNELMADNVETVSDESGEFDDWLELYNRGLEPIDLLGYFVSDDPEDPFAFALPDLQLAPGEYLLIWCDNDEEQGPLHAPFGLSKSGESAVLATEAEIVDQVDFDEQPTDVSYARATDGGEPWQLCFSPSPASKNACSNEPPTPTEPSATDTPATPETPSATPETPTATPETPTVNPESFDVFLPSLFKP